MDDFKKYLNVVVARKDQIMSELVPSHQTLHENVSMSEFRANLKKYVPLLTQKAGKETLVDIYRCNHDGYIRLIKFVSSYMSKTHNCDNVRPLAELVKTLDNDDKRYYESLSKFDWSSRNTGIRRRYIIYCSLLDTVARFHFTYENSDTLSNVTRVIVPSILDENSMYMDIGYSKFDENTLKQKSIMPHEPYTRN